MIQTISRKQEQYACCRFYCIATAKCSSGDISLCRANGFQMQVCLGCTCWSLWYCFAFVISYFQDLQKRSTHQLSQHDLHRMHYQQKFRQHPHIPRICGIITQVHECLDFLRKCVVEMPNFRASAERSLNTVLWSQNRVSVNSPNCP